MRRIELTMKNGGTLVLLAECAIGYHDKSQAGGTTRERGNAPFVICTEHITAIEELKFGGTLIYVSAVLALLGVDKGNANEYTDRELDK